MVSVIVDVVVVTFSLSVRVGVGVFHMCVIYMFSTAKAVAACAKVPGVDLAVAGVVGVIVVIVRHVALAAIRSI